MHLRYFGTDGMRGPFGEPPMEESFMRRLGYAVAQYGALRRPGSKLEIVAGRDPRLSGRTILRALAEGLVAHGHRVLDLGVVPTPAVPLAVLEWGADLGLMITASHNPPGDNGIKFFDERGLKLETGAEAEIEACLGHARAPAEPPQTVAITQADALELFLRTRTAVLPAHALAGWVVAVDPGHGATCATTPEVLRRLGATVHTRAADPDGALINTDAGSEHPAQLAALVKQTGARVGFAHDGDGDRLVACDETGAIVDGDQILGLLALHFLRKGELRGNILVATVQSNLGLDQTLAAAGGRVERVAVGDRNVLHRLLELNATFGGENSGHYIFPEIARCGDGLLAALMLARVMRETGQPLSTLRAEVKLLPQVTANLRVQEKRPLDETPTLGPALLAVEKTLEGRGRVLARYSGTEKKLRLLVEGPAAHEIKQALETLKKAAAKDLGAE